MTPSEWKKAFREGKAARVNLVPLSQSLSSAWRTGWLQQDELLRLRTERRTTHMKPSAAPRKVVYAPTIRPARNDPPPMAIDQAMIKRRMMGGGRFVR